MTHPKAAPLRASFVAAAFAMLPLTQSAHAQSEPVYKSPEEASAKLAQFCAPSRMTTFKNHAECLQETSGQVWQFAESFHASLFTAKGIEPDARNYVEMVNAWQKTIAKKNLPTAELDFLALRNYAHVCYDILQENIFTPEAPLSFSYTTGYNVPKSCVDTAVYFSKTYGVKINSTEASRLEKHLSSMYKFYTAHPVIPQPNNDKGQPKSPEKATTPAPFPACKGWQCEA